MTKLEKIVEGLLIFKKYFDQTPTRRRGDINFEHDECFAGPLPSIVSEEDKKRLEELGWGPDEENDCWHHF